VSAPEQVLKDRMRSVKELIRIGNGLVRDAAALVITARRHIVASRNRVGIFAHRPDNKGT